MFGCYPKGQANDPDTYTAAIAAVLAEYPADVICTVTDPRTGLPRRLKWLPAVAEVADACDAEVESRRLRAMADERARRASAKPVEPEVERTPESDAAMAARFQKLREDLQAKATADEEERKERKRREVYARMAEKARHPHPTPAPQ